MQLKRITKLCLGNRIHASAIMNLQYKWYLKKSFTMIENGNGKDRFNAMKDYLSLLHGCNLAQTKTLNSKISYCRVSDLLKRRVRQSNDFTALELRIYVRYITNISFQKYLIISRNLNRLISMIMKIWREITYMFSCTFQGIWQLLL